MPGGTSGTRITHTGIVKVASPLRTRTGLQIDKMFRARADGNRLRILNLLQDRELCVSDLITIPRVPRARASGGCCPR